MASVSLIIAAVLGWMGDFVEKLAARFEAFSELHKLELSELKKELADLLGQLKSPLLVVVDDVDRLSLKQLFPQTNWALSNYGYGSGFEEGWMRDVRVCYPNVFDRYFQFTIPEGDISQAELEVILSLTGDRQGLVSEFHSLKNRGLLEVALDRLEAYKQQIDLKDAEAFVTAIFDSGDDLPPGETSTFVIEPAIHAIRIIHWYLKQEKIPPNGEIS